MFSGSGGVSAGWEERAGEHETGPGETDQNAGVCPQTREVSQMSSTLVHHVHLALWRNVVQAQGIVIGWWKSFRCLLFKNLPSCGHLCGCRAKHQKLKTGNDQSPGDKKPETETDQRMFNQHLLLLCCLHIIAIDQRFFYVVPNGPAESDSEPANQMSWKEGRQLLRK